MSARYTFRVVLTRNDETQEDLGTVVVESEEYGDTTEIEALDVALTEMKTVGAFLRFRSKLFQASAMRSIDVVLLSAENIGAGVPYEDLVNPTGDAPA